MTSTNPFMTWTGTRTQTPDELALEATVRRESARIKEDSKRRNAAIDDENLAFLTAVAKENETYVPRDYSAPKRRAGLGAILALGALTLGSALGLTSPARAEPVPQSYSEQAVEASTFPFRYASPATANAGGMNGSFWVTVVRGRNLSDSPATVKYTIHPRGQAASDSDPSITTSLAPGETIDRINMLADIGFEGAGMLEVQSDQPLGLNDSVTGNVSSTNGSFQGGNLPFFDLNNPSADPRVTQAGDIREIRLGNPDNRRSNFIDANLSMNAAKDIVYMIENGQVVQQATVDVPPMGYVQISPIYSIFPGVVPKPGQTLRVLTTASDPNTSVATVAYISEIDNVTSTSQDPALLSGYIRPLITNQTVSVSPTKQLEVNDLVTQTASFTSRAGTRIEAIYAKPSTQTADGWLWNVQGNGTNSLMYQESLTAVLPGEVGIKTRVMVWDGTSVPAGGYIRDVTSNIATVIPAQDLIPADAYNLTKTNTSTLSHLLGDNLNVVFMGDMKHYPQTDVLASLATYTDGTTGPSNPELKKVTIYKSLGQLAFEFTDGRISAFGGLSQTQTQTVRDLYKVKPQ
jgi:hypothetical protein